MQNPFRRSEREQDEKAVLDALKRRHHVGWSSSDDLQRMVDSISHRRLDGALNRLVAKKRVNSKDYRGRTWYWLPEKGQ